MRSDAAAWSEGGTEGVLAVKGDGQTTVPCQHDHPDLGHRERDRAIQLSEGGQRGWAETPGAAVELARSDSAKRDHRDEESEQSEPNQEDEDDAPSHLRSGSL